MEQNAAGEYTREEIKEKLRQNFDGKIVRKDLTKKIKEGANVPVYVLEFLLGQYCSSDDDAIIEQGVQKVKRILADNFVRPDEAQKILAKLRKNDSHTVIDMITVRLDIKRNRFFAAFSNLGLGDVPIEDEYPEKYDRLLCGGIWCIVQLNYEYDEEDKKNGYPIQIQKLTPIQMPHVDIDELKSGRKAFSKDEWIDVLLRSIGMEPDELNYREKWLLLTRMIPLVENNFNLCELGPRSTGKSHLFKEISPNSILVSGGQTTVANLFYNMGRKTVGLVGLWDCVVFDEVAGIHFKDNDGVQIMKDYMASGSFARGKEEKAASASMVFVGNINQSVDVLLKTSSLFDPFPPEMGTDTAFLDRMHCYLPGWEIPKFRPEHFTDDYGFITDYLSEFIRELRKEQYGDSLDHYFRLGKNLNQRDTIAVRRMVDGYLKLVYPDGEFTKEEVEEVLQLSLEMRRRVKEQLKKLGGMEFYDVNFSYIDNETFEEHYVSVPEQGGGKLIPEGMCNPGQVYTVSQGKSGMIGVFRLESQMLPGSGKFERTGIGSDRDCKEATNTAFNFLKANGSRISGSISTTTKDYIINYQDLQGIGMTSKLALPTLIALCSIALGKPALGSLAVLGEISISGTLIKAGELANSLQVCLDSGAKKVLIPATSMIDFATVPPDLMSAFQLIPYQSAEDAVFKALGVSASYAQEAIAITERILTIYDWQASNPKGYALWFARKEDKKPISAIVTTLAAQIASHAAPSLSTYELLEFVSNDIERYSALLQGKTTGYYSNYEERAYIKKDDQRWTINNPVDPNDNYADSWDDETASLFFRWAAAVKQDFIDISEMEQEKYYAGLKNGMGAALVEKTLPVQTINKSVKPVSITGTKPWRC